MLLAPRPPSLGIDLCDPIADHPLNAGRLAWWFGLPESIGGPRYYDLRGLAHGTLAGMPGSGTASSGWGLATSRPGGRGELRFDGADDRVTVGTPAHLASLGPFTLAAWVWAKDTGGAGFGRILSKLTTGGGWDFGARNDGAAGGSITGEFTLSFGLSSTNLSLTTTGNALKRNAWLRVMLAWDGTGNASSTFRCYINGLAAPLSIASAGSGTHGGDAAQSLILGNVVAANRGWNGFLDDLSIWSRAISADEAAFDYDQSRQAYPDAINRVRPSVAVFMGGAATPNPLAIDATFPKLAASAAMTSSNPTTVAASFPALTAAASLAQSNPASIAAAFPGLSASVSLSQGSSLAIAASFPKLTASATLSQVSGLSLAASFPAIVATASLESANPATLGATFPAMSASFLLGTQAPVDLSIAATFPALSASAALASANPLAVAAMLGRLTAAFVLSQSAPPTGIDPPRHPDPRRSSPRRIGVDPSKSQPERI